MKNLPSHMTGGASPSLLDRLVAWVASLFAARVEERKADELERLVALLRLKLAKRLAFAWRGVTGETAAENFSRGAETGRAIGAGVGAAVGAAAGSTGIAQIVEVTGGLLVGLVLAILPLEKENLRARVNDEIRTWSPIERYLALALIPTLANASRRKEGQPILVDAWRTDGGGFKTVWGPLWTIAGHFHLESLFEGEFPPFPATIDDPRTLYVLACAVASEDDGAKLSDVGSVMSTSRSGAGAWYRAAYDAAGQPTAGALRARAIAAGLSGLTDTPVGEWARPAIEDALRARGAR